MPPHPASARTMIELGIVVGSTRPRRIGPVVADWLRNEVPPDTFAVTVLDLAEIGLPLLDEPELAATGIYTHEHTRHWSRLVGSVDALVLVTPEYNNGYPAAVKNAIDYLYAEWADKPVAVFGYGYRGAASCREQLATVLRRVHARVVDGVGLRLRDHLVGEPGAAAAVRPDAELLGATRRMLDALAQAVIAGTDAVEDVRPTV